MADPKGIVLLTKHQSVPSGLIGFVITNCPLVMFRNGDGEERPLPAFTLTPDQARELAADLLHRADQIEDDNGL